MKIDPKKLLPGDLLLYSSDRSLLGWAIKVKTWSQYSHIEQFVGNSTSMGSRAEGVGFYPLRTSGLALVLRPKVPFDIASGIYAMRTKYLGQKYDVWGLFRFYTIGKQSLDKQFCSEVCTRLCRDEGMEPFDPSTDADLVAPGTFTYSPIFTHINPVSLL